MAQTSKAQKLLGALQKNLGRWTCGYHNSDSNQPAAIFRELKKLGYVFEETGPKRWAKELFCEKCGLERSHYLLKFKEPQHPEKERFAIRPADRRRVLRVLGDRDAFTGASITSGLEIDHKTPWSRLKRDVDAGTLSDAGLSEHYQVLTKEHNALKDKKCGECERSGRRPPFLEISFWYEGGERYDGSCIGCGWHDGARWRQELNLKLERDA
jgi:hypothetical protein